MSALTQTDIRNELWRRGNLSWKLHEGQKSLYELFYNTKDKTNVWLCGRRIGKSYTLVVIAIETCLRTPNVVVKIVSPTKMQVDTNLRPLFKKILDDCPTIIKPRYVSKDYTYYFPNGSEIQLAGTDSGHAEKLRGSECGLAIVDEAGSCENLKNVVKNVLLPSTLLSRGKVILASTPPMSYEHDFISFIQEAELKGNLIVKPSHSNPLIPPEEMDLMIKELGGTGSEAYKREILCVDENTLIKTKEGYKEIKNIEKNDQVFTHDGTYQKVLTKFKTPLSKRKVYKVKCSNNEGVIVTGEHKVQVAISNYKKLKNGYLTKWEKVQNLNPKHKTKRLYFKVPLDKHITENNMEKDLAYLVGWWIAEGSFGKNNIVLSLNFKDPIDKINEISKKYFGKEFKIYTINKEKTCFQAVLCLKSAIPFFEQFGRGAKNKKIPYWLKTAPRPVKRALLKGLFEGDGYYTIDGKRAGFTTISKSLLTDISDILLSLKIPHSTIKAKEAGPSVILGRNVNIQDSFQIKINGKNFDRFLISIHNIKTTFRSINKRNHIRDGYFFSRIHEIEELTDYNKQWVYDLEIENSHSYVGFHATFHNCEIIRDSNLSVIPEFTQDLEKEVVQEWTKPPFYDAYVGMDLGFKDFTGVVFGYYDFKNDCVVIEDEILMNFQESDKNLPVLTKQIQDKESIHFLDLKTNEIKKPFKRVSDLNPIVTQEIGRISHYEVTFINANKSDKDASLNKFRLLLSNRKIMINPRCINLIRQIKNARWASEANKKTFSRSTVDGHYDLLDAAIMLVDSISYGKNPYPQFYNMNTQDLFIKNRKNQQLSNNNYADVFSKIFNSPKGTRDKQNPAMKYFNKPDGKK